MDWKAAASASVLRIVHPDGERPLALRPAVLKNISAAAVSGKAIAAELEKQGLLVPRSNGRRTRELRLPGSKFGVTFIASGYTSIQRIIASGLSAKRRILYWSRVLRRSDHRVNASSAPLPEPQQRSSKSAPLVYKRAGVRDRRKPEAREFATERPQSGAKRKYAISQWGFRSAPIPAVRRDLIEPRKVDPVPRNGYERSIKLTLL